MEITCTQMDVLISFYIDGDLSPTLKKKVEEHMNNCSTCRAKYNILSSVLTDMKNLCKNNNEEMMVGNVMTEYEEKFSALGNPIHRMVARKPKR